LQCNGARPSCGQCVAINRDCPGYAESFKFVDEGAKVLHRHRKRTASQKIRSSRSEPNKSAATKDHALESEAAVLPDGNDSGILAPHVVEPSDLIRLDDASCLASGAVVLQQAEALAHSSAPNTAFVAAGNESAINVLGQGPPSNPYSLLPPGMSNAYAAELGALMSEFLLDSEREMVFLLRHYTEKVAPW
jgi:hypothetical protein